MDSYSRGLDVRRVRSKSDVVKLNMITEAISQGINPLGLTIHGSSNSIVINEEDIFAYCMETKKPFSIIISGRSK